MVARRPYQDGAGPWVAYMDHTRYSAKTDTRVPCRSYVYNTTTAWGSWTGTKADAMRFDTKAEALAFVRRGPRRRGIRTGAERA